MQTHSVRAEEADGLPLQGSVPRWKELGGELVSSGARARADAGSSPRTWGREEPVGGGSRRREPGTEGQALPSAESLGSCCCQRL